MLSAFFYIGFSFVMFNGGTMKAEVLFSFLGNPLYSDCFDWLL